MLTDVELQSLQSLKGILENFKKSKVEAEKNLKEIDDKYKAIIEKEKKSYKEIISACEKEIKFWEKPIIKRYGKPLDELLANPDGAVETEEKEEADDLPFSDDEKVVDTEAVEESAEEAPEFDGAGFTEEDNVAPAEEPVEEKPRNLDAEEDAEWEKKIASGEIVEAKTKEAAADDWETNTESEAQKEDDNDGWGDFPEEWKD